MNEERGVAYEFWLAIERARAAKPWTKSELSERTKVARTTIDNLRKATRPPGTRVVTTLADALGIDTSTALELAGITPPPPGPAPDVRTAIEASSYTDTQKSTLLHMVDVFDRENRR